MDLAMAQRLVNRRKAAGLSQEALKTCHNKPVPFWQVTRRF